eukprot:GGOE01049806.1.p2 GENE.GGOE01049806.1~~GGOE01049806.1.p2  ORF type:complete len:165 (-),score=60.87 GGOE01049806.1:275-769(-)
MCVLHQRRTPRPPKVSTRPAVAAILQEFTQAAASTPREKCLAVYFSHGLKLIFNANVERCLLYRGERPLCQAEAAGERLKVRKPTRKDTAGPALPADVYGGIHLLRLLVKLPSLLQQYNAYNHEGQLTAAGHEAVQRRVEELLQFLAARADRLFPRKEDYVPAE